MTRRVIASGALALLLAGGAAWAAHHELAGSGTYTGTFGWWSAGKVHQIEEGHVVFTGEFTGTFFNDAGEGFLHKASVACPGINDLDFNNKKNAARGYCVVTDGDGDQAYIKWRCEGDTVRCPGSFEWTGGTGKYEGISGKNTFTGVNGPPNPDGSLSGYSPWQGEWQLP